MIADLSDEEQARLTSECRLRLAQHRERHGNEPQDWIDFWTAAWWSGIEAMLAPRDASMVESDLALIRARAIGLIK